MWKKITGSLYFRFAKAELNVLRYALVPPMHRSGEGVQEFFVSRDAAQLAWAFVILALIEAFAFHLLLAGIGSRSVWLVLIFADVFILYTIGFVRSLPRVPAVIVMENGDVIIQVGVLFRMEIEAGAIADLSETITSDINRRAFRGALLSNPNCAFVFKGPQKGTIFSLFPIRRSAVTLKINELERLRTNFSRAS